QGAAHRVRDGYFIGLSFLGSAALAPVQRDAAGAQVRAVLPSEGMIYEKSFRPFCSKPDWRASPA
ncbi:MAG: hypothetical protein WCI88_11875, partial [Chloroflexota bacterium]